VQLADWTEWHWLEIVDFNIAALSGRASFCADIKTGLPPPDVPAPPRKLCAVFTGEHTANLSFEAPPNATSYWLYARKNREGWEQGPFVKLRQLDAAKLEKFDLSQGFLYVAVTAVDAAGKESGLSNVAFCGRMQGLSKVAVARDGTYRYFSDTHPHTGRIVRQNRDGTIDDWDVRPQRDTGGRYLGLALAKSGRLLATNVEGHRLHLFAPTGDAVKCIGGKGAGNGQFNRPGGVAVDEQDGVYVADTLNNRVQVFDKDLAYRATITADFKEPQGVCVMAQGRLAVADTGNKRIVILELAADGSWRVAKELRDGLKQPRDVCSDGQGRVVVADTEAQAVVVFNPDGTQKAFKSLGPVGGVCVTADGVILAPVPWQGVHELRLGP